LSKKVPPILKKIKQYPLQDIDYKFQKSISYSQFSDYVKCPHKWDLSYKRKLSPFTSSIHTVFGSAIHSAIQEYMRLSYEESNKKANEFDIETFFHEKFMEEYKKGYTQNDNKHFSSPEEMKEFFEDGAEILKYFKKNKSKYFPTRSWWLVGIELPLILKPNPKYGNLYYRAYLDLVLYNEKTECFVIIDFKTSTSGWNASAKQDDLKNFQLVLYKKFFSQIYGVDESKVMIEFIILKRKLYEHIEFPQKRIQSHIPPSGKIKTNKVLKLMDEFITDAFEPSGGFKDKTFPKNVSDACKWCVFKDKPNLCDRK